MKRRGEALDGPSSGRWAVAVTMDAVHLVHDGRVMRVPVEGSGAPSLYGDGEWLEPLEAPVVVEVGEPLHLTVPVAGSSAGHVKVRTSSPVVAAVQVDLDTCKTIVRYSPDASPIPGGSG